jgi:hypothetical protein
VELISCLEIMNDAAALMAEASCDQDFSEDADEESLLKLVQEQEDGVAEAATASIMSSLHSFDGGHRPRREDAGHRPKATRANQAPAFAG